MVHCTSIAVNMVIKIHITKLAIRKTEEYHSNLYAILIIINIIIPCSLLIKTIMTRRFRFFFLIGIIMSTLHMRVHLKHFELFLYIRNFAHPNDNFSAAFEHRVNCFINEYRNHTLWCGLLLCL